MTKLLEKLTHEVSKKTKKETNLVESAKLLLSSNEAEERKLLESIGLCNELNYFEQKQSTIKVQKELTEKYGATIVRREDLTMFCIKYGLIIRNPTQYTGKIPLDAGIKLRAFVENNKIAVGAHTSYNTEFCVVAPPKLFGHANPIANVVKNTILNAKANADKYYEEQRLRDPMLIYNINGEFSAIIHAWGEDETITRRIAGFFYNNLFKAFSWLFCLIAWPTIIGTLTLFVGYLLNLAINHYFPIATFPKGNDNLHFVVFALQWIAFLSSTIVYWSSDSLFAQTHKINKTLNPYPNIWTDL